MFRRLLQPRLDHLSFSSEWLQGSFSTFLSHCLLNTGQIIHVQALKVNLGFLHQRRWRCIQPQIGQLIVEGETGVITLVGRVWASSRSILNWGKVWNVEFFPLSILILLQIYTYTFLRLLLAITVCLAAINWDHLTLPYVSGLICWPCGAIVFHHRFLSKRNFCNFSCLKLDFHIHRYIHFLLAGCFGKDRLYVRLYFKLECRVRCFIFSEIFFSGLLIGWSYGNFTG